MASLPTIRIKSGSGFSTINESDFDPFKHERYSEKAPDGGQSAEVATSPAGGAEAVDPPSSQPDAPASVPPSDEQPEPPKKKGKGKR